MWLGELDEFLAAWTKHEAVMLSMMTAGASVGSGGLAKKKLVKKGGSSK
jgi:hypothetical protein